ncbi:6-pyruvoyl trahydropterin synthase family protein [Streptomyces sp. NEAU-Y11]|uniref:6-pyruvoyl trahydropterin synthase family protein n=1 Tax=Streptomyces cucumeris TaxID=2962890 RepID=UPI0020C8AE3D|nr:6-carboxytetrahydropterin synthase [Streptomyces sp. NEAU-Y11]MCP9206817.1 6-carboxytetrahydropterin synthase [Streptomyces sp. NEAU-Y11]MCP9211647.1 6-carboxytetrahydropterin synthase [Streptomyces sp. NEAU-Y11]
MTHSVTVRHNFETAHRLPHLGGKCTNLHGHSWWCEVTVSAPRTDRGTVAEFGDFKAGIRTWIDTWLDHGTMLGAADPLVGALGEEKCKIFRFGAQDDPTDAEKLAADLTAPTVENVAELVFRVARATLESISHASGASITQVKVSETHVNAASYRPVP